MIQEHELACVTVDALAGGGLVLLRGDLVSRSTFPEHFDALLNEGALELCQPQLGVAQRVELL